MKTLHIWLAGRTPREQGLLAIMAAVLILGLAYSRVYLPLTEERRALTADIAALEIAMARVRAAGPDAVRRAAVTITQSTPAATLIAQSAPRFGIPIQRVDTTGGETRVDVGRASFDDLLQWLAMLDDAHGLRIGSIDMSRRPEPGVVSARVTFEGRS